MKKYNFDVISILHIFYYNTELYCLATLLFLKILLNNWIQFDLKIE